MSIRRSARQQAAPGRPDARASSYPDARNTERTQQFVCLFCHKQCKTEHYLRQHQQQNALCGIMSAPNLHQTQTYPSQLVAAAMSNVLPIAMNKEATGARREPFEASDAVPGNPPSVPPTDLEILFDPEFPDVDERLSDHSDNVIDDLAELLDNRPLEDGPNIPAEHSHSMAPFVPTGSTLDEQHHTYDYDPFIDDDVSSSQNSNDASVDLTGLPTIPEAHGRCQPVDLSIPISPVRNITNSLAEQQSLEGMSSIQDRLMLKLILMLDSFRAPHYSFQKILEWVDECINNNLLARGLHGRNFHPMKRNTFMKQLEKLFPSVPRPVQSVVPIEDTLTHQFHSGLSHLPLTTEGTSTQQLIDEYRRSSRATAIVPHFDARQQVISLLSDSALFGDPNNLHVNQTNSPDDLFMPYRPAPAQPLSNIHSGSWYQRTVRSPDFDPRREFMIPLIGYIDATGTDAYSRFKLEPFLISFTIFKPNVLGKAQSWRLLGMVPDLELDSSARKARQRNLKNNEGKAMHCRNYHNMLKFTLSSLIELQKNGLDYNLRIGNYEKRVRLRFPIAFISGDGKSNNMLCGRYTSHQSQVLRQCRACLVHRDDLINTVDDCFKIPQEIPWFLVNHLHNLAEKQNQTDNVLSPPDASDSPVVDHDNTAAGVGMSEDASDGYISSQTIESSNDPPYEEEDVPEPPSPNSRSSSSSEEVSEPSKEAPLPAPSEHTMQFRQLLAERKQLHTITARQKNEMTDEERKHLNEKKVSNRNQLYAQCSAMIQHVVGPKQLNSLSTKHWLHIRQKIWHWANCFTINETKEFLRVIAQYESRLATHELDYGGDRYGVNMCTPTDLMHAFLLGVVRYACQSMMDVWPTRLRASIDNIVDSNIRSQMQQERSFFPRADFSKGVTNLTQLTAQEWIGLCFTLYLVLISGDGRNAILSVLPSYDIDDSIDCLAKMLSFVAYYKYGTYWHLQDLEKQAELLQSIKQMSSDIQHALPRKEGVGWYLSKMHEILHTPMDIDRYGCPAGYDACTGERLLKFLAKLPAVTAQRQKYSDFMMQVCQRLYHGQLLHLAKLRWIPDDDSDTPEVTEHQHCLSMIQKKYCENDVVLNRFHPTIRHWECTMSIGTPIVQEPEHNPGRARYAVVNERSLEVRRNGMKPNLSPLILEAIYNYVADAVTKDIELSSTLSNNVGQTVPTINSSFGEIRTVLVTGYSEGMIFRNKQSDQTPATILSRCTEENVVCFRVRCHPSYRGSRPWHDWINVSATCHGEDSPSCPCKLLSMFSYRYLDADRSSPEKTMSVVWSVSATETQGEVLAERRLRMFASVEDDLGASTPILSVVDVNATAISRVLVIEDAPLLKDIYHSPIHDRCFPHYCSVVADMRTQWANEFTGAIGNESDYDAIVERRLHRLAEKNRRRSERSANNRSALEETMGGTSSNRSPAAESMGSTTRSRSRKRGRESRQLAHSDDSPRRTRSSSRIDVSRRRSLF